MRWHRRRGVEAATEGPWNPGVLPTLLESEWDTIEVHPAGFWEGRGRESLGITCRRASPEAFARIDIYWVSADHGYDESGFCFEGSLLNRAWYELSPELQSGIDEGIDDFFGDDEGEVVDVGVRVPLVLDGTERTTHQLDLGSLRYVGVDWSPDLAIEIVTADADPLRLAHGLRPVSGEQISEFVADHPVGD